MRKRAYKVRIFVKGRHRMRGFFARAEDTNMTSITREEYDALVYAQEPIPKVWYLIEANGEPKEL